MPYPVDAQLGSLALRFAGRSVSVAKAQIFFTKAEFSIFSSIALSGESGVSLDRLCAEIGHASSPRAIAIVRTNISTIRRKISNLEEGAVAIESSADSRSFRMRARDQNDLTMRA
jgi:DNA-binding response OmpR family regulator